MKTPQKKRVWIWTLLRKNLSKSQLVGYGIANLIGLTVILAGILFFCDSRSSASSGDSLFSDDYIVISKKVKGVNLEPLAFSEDELNEIREQPWVRDVGYFTASQFTVEASVSMGGKGISTYMFMESVPDKFFDTKPSGWEFNPKTKFVPIVLNKDYLALYNFGFAIPQGLPQISEEIIGTVPLKLRISGKNGLSDVYDASVVGFSSRLNTIAVPQDFMDWANERYASGNTEEPSRLIIKIDRLDSAPLDSFMDKHGYEIAGDKEGESKISDFLGVVSGVVSAIGLLISILSIFILILSIFLLLQKSRGMLRKLILFGYSPQEVGKNYERMVVLTNTLITLIAVGLTFLCRLIWLDPLRTLGLGDGNVLPMLGAALLYFIIIISINILIIRKHLLKIWYNR